MDRWWDYSSKFENAGDSCGWSLHCLLYSLGEIAFTLIVLAVVISAWLLLRQYFTRWHWQKLYETGKVVASADDIYPRKNLLELWNGLNKTGGYKYDPIGDSQRH